MTLAQRKQYARDCLLAGRPIPFKVTQEIAAYLMQQVSDNHLAKLKSRMDTAQTARHERVYSKRYNENVRLKVIMQNTGNVYYWSNRV